LKRTVLDVFCAGCAGIAVVYWGGNQNCIFCSEIFISLGIVAGDIPGVDARRWEGTVVFIKRGRGVIGHVEGSIGRGIELDFTGNIRTLDGV